MEWLKSTSTKIDPMCQRRCTNFDCCYDKYVCVVKICTSKGCSDYGCGILIG